MLAYSDHCCYIPNNPRGKSIMKKTITIICIILSAVLILDSMDAWHAIVMFYIAGEIPGTHQSLNAGTMLIVFAILTGFVVARVGNTAVLSLFERISAAIKTKLKRI